MVCLTDKQFMGAFAGNSYYLVCLGVKEETSGLLIFGQTVLLSASLALGQFQTHALTLVTFLILLIVLAMIDQAFLLYLSPNIIHISEHSTGQAECPRSIKYIVR